MLEIGRSNRDCLAILAFIALAGFFYLNLFAKERFFGEVEEYQIDKISVQYELLGEKIRLLEEKLEETDEENSVTENEVESLREEIQFLQNNAAAGELMKSDSLETLGGRFYPAPKAEETISDEEWEEITEDEDEDESSESEEENYDDLYENAVEESQKICPLSAEYTAAEFREENVLAKYETRPDKFLTSVLMNGPNNQLLGLRETMFIAIKLKRSYIMPKFFKHDRADPTAVHEYLEEVEPNERVSILKMRRLMNTKPLESVPDICENGEFSVFYQLARKGGSQNQGRLIKTCEKVDCEVDNVNCDEWNEGVCLENVSLPKVPNLNKTPMKLSRLAQDGNNTIMETIYDSDHSCAIMAYPYMDINFARNLFHPKINDEDKELMKDIMKATGRPLHIEEVVQEFVKNAIGGDETYVSMHWRYNAGDWWHGGCDIKDGHYKAAKRNGDGEDKIPEICRKLTYMRDPRNFAMQVNEFLTKTWANVNNEKGRIIPNIIKTMYIATPPSELDLMERMREELKKINPELKIFVQTDIEPFIRKYYKNAGCSELDDRFWEILSMAEQEVCLQSSVFLHSAGSSWSKNTNIERSIHDYPVRDGEVEASIMPRGDFR
ncbi:Oidioi.mRNA.OKI2018_I69.chr2.g4420.t1.cds [Oikopleura dioica]|uniref:Oidioi.mRNA.OKI2018_I69.chr2.g4420.t1.cds n=1 Tax=Oikopleura dioica TaxID=34765 RepID=A0ABN7T3P9_OIKDI|nr:Oidioi.mRNA.OKI2018_I69.chr2.g4420.t1.cds [Oikopleura dioica]